MAIRSCKMPSVEDLGNAKAKYLISSLTSSGKNLRLNENLYLKIFARLIDKSIHEYQQAREYLLEEMDDNLHGENRDSRTIAIFGFWDYMENCISSIRRLYRIFDRIKSTEGNLTTDRTERRLIEKDYDVIKELRDTVEHIDEKIDELDSYVLSVTDDEEGIAIANYELKFDDLAKIIARFDKIGHDWIDIYDNS